MPLVDMSLEQLKKYNGMNPRPADFDAFWDASLEEMRAMDPKVSLTPYPLSSRFADFYELRFRSTKNALIYAKLAKPKRFEGKLPAVLKFHGLSGSSDSWNDLLRYVSEGYCVTWAARRGRPTARPSRAVWMETPRICIIATSFWIPPCWHGW